MYRSSLFQINYFGIEYYCSNAVWNGPHPVLQQKKKDLLICFFFSPTLSYDGNLDKYNNIT